MYMTQLIVGLTQLNIMIFYLALFRIVFSQKFATKYLHVKDCRIYVLQLIFQHTLLLNMYSKNKDAFDQVAFIIEYHINRHM